MYEQYEHHGAKVWVRSDLKGKHRDHCLCHSCTKFKPGTNENCSRAAHLYTFCVLLDMTTPVWECPEFKREDDDEFMKR